jgi:CYTH domain-containing protein
MQSAIERKFLIHTLPNLSTIEPISYEKRFISLTQTTEIRVQKKWDIYQLQRKVLVTQWDNTKQKRSITKEEFVQLKRSAIHTSPILRDTYKITPLLQICIYHGHNTWLIRAEVEFESQEDADKYVPELRMGEEITDEKAWRDRYLLS